MTTLSYTGFRQCFYRGEKPFFPTKDNVESRLVDISKNSSLHWKFPETERLLLWEIVSDLWQLPFVTEAEILAYERGLDYFIQNHLEGEKTFGVLLYKGDVHFSRELVRSFAARLPQDILPFLAIDARGLSSEEFLTLLKREELTYFGLIVKGFQHPYALPAIGWESPSPWGIYEGGEILPQKRLPLALCQPKEGRFTLPKSLCRVIPEELLIYEWEGVDQLIVPELSPEGKRGVRGYLATGGEVLEPHQVV